MEATVLEIEESVEATAQSNPAERRGVRIPKVPEGHRYGGRDANEPSIISIGPYHHGKPTLLPMESLKRQCFYRVGRRNQSNRTLDAWFMNLLQEGMATKARRCYSENTDNIIEDKDFLEMMMFDACFIVEYCDCIKKNTLPELLGGRIWVDTAIRNDLLLLENQIPFFFVMKVFSILQLESPHPLMNLVDCFCRHVSPINTNRYYFPKAYYFSDKQLDDPSGSEHLLYFYRYCLFYRQEIVTLSPDTAFPNAEKPICTIRSATFLEEAGIKFEERTSQEGIEFEEKTSQVITVSEPLRYSASAIDVTFGNGVMEITPLFIDAFTVSQFRNLVALEKGDSSLEPRATAFAQFMDSIINTSKDVDLLRKKGILDHSLGSDEEVATIFNQLSSGILEYRGPELEKLYKDVDKYCKTKRHLWRAILMKNYFGSPWTAISLVAAVILLSLTFIQTFFSMYSYFRPPSAK